jgi:flavin reductase (DIM6/NTAB) family NADH-FMN oxidoreductase RutF
MSKKNLAPNTLLYPVPVVLVSCVGNDSVPNIITIAWTGVICSDPPMVSISVRPSRFSHNLIQESQEFVVNLPTEKIIEETDFCGIVSGRKVDKFFQTKFTALPAQKVKAPLIKECPVNLECVVKNTITLGTHDMFLGEIVALHVDEDKLDAKGRVDVFALSPLAYCPTVSEYWSLGSQLGVYGFSKGKLAAEE